MAAMVSNSNESPEVMKLPVSASDLDDHSVLSFSFFPKNASVRIAVWLFIGLVALYLMVIRGHLTSTDEIKYYQQTKSFWERGDLSIKCSQAFPGRDGLRYCSSGTGNSFAAFPFFALGRFISWCCIWSGHPEWIAVFSGPTISNKVDVWGGEIEICFSMLLNVVLMALLGSIFFAFNLRLGIKPKWALASALCLCLASYPACQSSGFFLHISESVFLLWSFYFLFMDSKNPRKMTRILAGITVSMMLFCRFQAVIFLPGLVLYHLCIIWLRKPTNISFLGLFRWAAIQVLPFFIIFSIGIWHNYKEKCFKLGIEKPLQVQSIMAVCSNLERPIYSSLFTGAYGLLFSPGLSVFLYCPLLILCPWTIRKFASRYKLETAFIAFQSLSCLYFASKLECWHGMWAYGPRYLTATVPLLLLPLSLWLQRAKFLSWITFVPLTLFGFWVVITSVFVNYWYVALIDGYLDWKPLYSHLFFPSSCPIIAHTKALMIWDTRVDTWLINVFRGYGMGLTALFLLPLISIAIFAGIKIRNNLREIESQQENVQPLDFSVLRNLVACVLGITFLFTGLVWGFDPEGIFHKPNFLGSNTALEQAVFLNTANHVLNVQRNPKEASLYFRKVLQLNPYHIPANTGLAQALLITGEAKEAIYYLKTALDQIERTEGQPDAEMVRSQIEKLTASR